MKKVVSASAVVVGSLPAIVPAVRAAQGMAQGGTVEGAINAGLAPLGMNTSGSVNWQTLSKYGVFTGACWGAMIGMRYLGKKL